MKVLITGGAGFIGSHLADCLVGSGEQVQVIDNLVTGNVRNLASPGIILHKVDIKDRGPVRDLVEGMDAVVHCAAAYKDPFDYVGATLTNTKGTSNIVEACEDFGIKKLIYLQTSLCYGQVGGLIPVGRYFNPSGPYAITKTIAEMLITTSNLDYTVFRLANIYGPRNLSGAVPTFYRNITGGEVSRVSDTRRTMIYVDDLLYLLKKTIYTSTGSRKIYHVGSREDVSIPELYTNMCRLLGRPERMKLLKRGADDVYSLLLESSITEKDFNWRPIVSLENGLKRAIEWYDEFGVGETYTHLRSRE